MTQGMSCPLAVLLVLAAAQESAPTGETSVPLYTNADLERVAPLRDQTGVASVPAVAPSIEEDQPRRSSERRAGSTKGQDAEAYWRRKAAQHRKRQEALAAKAKTLERQIAGEKVRRLRSLRSRDEAILDRLEERLESVERQRAEEDDQFEEAARRAGALPGWLR